MQSRPPPVVVVLVLLVVGGVLAALWWLPFDPFGGTAGRLDLLLPDDVDAVVRFDPATLATGTAAHDLWEHPAVASAREASGWEERVFAPLRDLEDRVGGAALGLAPSLERDVFGQEVILALRGADVLLLSRVTQRGRALDLVGHAASSDLESLGLRVEDDGTFVVSRDDAPAIYLKRHRDVLAASTSRGLVDGVAVLGEAAEEFGPRTVPYAAALDGARAPGARILYWARPEALRTAAMADEEPSAGDALSFWRALVPLDGLGPVEGVIDCSRDGVVALRLETAYLADLPPSLDALPGGAHADAALLQTEAERLAVPGETVVATGLAVGAEDCIRTLIESQPRARRKLLDEILADRGQTVGGLARAIAVHLRDGVAAVVARVRDVDEFDLETADGGLVIPAPATLVAFRLKDADGGPVVMDRLREDAMSLFGADLAASAESGPDGATVLGLTEHRFGGEWALLTPAFALTRDGWFVFCTNRGYLERALAQRASPPTADADAAADAERASARGVTANGVVYGAALRRYVDDQRWEWADRETYHDWKSERQGIREELDGRGGFMSPRDRQIYEDTRIDMRLRTRKEAEFPAAIARYRERWEALGVLASVRLAAALRGRRIELAVDVTVVR